MIPVTRSISIDASEIQEQFVRSSGPGGQNVNKVATAVQLRFDVAGSGSLPDDVRERLIRLAGRRMTAEGILIIEARRYRTRERNRRDAMDRLVALIRASAQRPRPRRKTAPTLASRKRRLQAKRIRGERKSLRRPVGRTDDQGRA